ncbi:MAG: hypothetical protein ABEH90_09340 [Halolamina sp.]
MSRTAGGQRRRRAVSTGLVAGVAGGLLSFVYHQASLLPSGVESWYILGLLTLVGAFVSPLVGHLGQSALSLLLAHVVGLGVHAVAWLSPVVYFDAPAYILLHIAITRRLGDAVVAWIFVFPLAVLFGYMTYVLVTGYFRP